MKHFSKEIFAAYVAAFMDGEGSILFQTVRGKIYIRCVLTNTHGGVLRSIHKRLGYGTLSKRPVRKKEWKQVYVLYVDGFENVEIFLKEIRPYLIIKAQKADAAFAVINKRKKAIDGYKERNRLIKLELEAGTPQVEIARKFDMSQQNISTIKLGHSWPSRAKNYRTIKR